MQDPALIRNETAGLKEKSTMLFLVILPLVLFVISFSMGRYPINPYQVIKIIAGSIFPIEHNWPAVLDTVILHIRLPRLAAAALIGASLSAAGAAYQGMFKNPLVSPDILGASSGAGFGAALAIFLSLPITGIQGLSFVFGLLAVSLTYTISRRLKQESMLALVLSGIMVGALFSSGLSLLKYMADPTDKLPSMVFWLMGSLSSVDPGDVAKVAVAVLVAAVPLLLVRWRLNVLSLGEEEAAALGIDLSRLKILVIICATLLTAVSICISGIIGWVGLIVPHLARMLVGPNYKVLLPASMLLGASYLMLVDDLARLLAAAEVPMGTLTALIGVPFFLYLLMKNRWGW